MVAAEQRLPDILYLVLTDVERASYGASGIFLPLNEYIENDAFFWHQTMEMWCTPEEKEELIKYGTSPDGNIYGYPAFFADPGDASALGMWINKDWCENLGFEIPTTTDELYAVLSAFKEQDANMNGDPNDEIPLMGCKVGTGNVAQYLMNSFIYYVFTPHFGYQLNVNDGVLSAPFLTDEFREGLRYMHKLSDEGLLAPQSFSQPSSELRAVMLAPNDQPTLVGAFVGHPSSMFGSEGAADRVFEYTGLPAMIGPEGVQWSAYKGMLGSYDTYITSSCEYPELAFRLLDAAAKTEVSLTMRNGEEGVHWEFESEGEVRHHYLEGYYPVYSQIGDISPWTSENNIIWHINTFNMLPPKLSAGQVAVPFTNPNRDYQMDTLWYSTVPLRHWRHPEEAAFKLIFTQEEMDAIGEIEASLRTYVDESLTRFILGDLDVENDWDNYISTLEGIGVYEYVEIAQTAYDRLNAE